MPRPSWGPQQPCARGVSSGCALLRAGTVQDPPGVMQDPPGAMQDLLRPAARRQRGLCRPPAPLAAAGGVWVAFRDKSPPATRASTPSDFYLAPRAAANALCDPFLPANRPFFQFLPELWSWCCMNTPSRRPTPSPCCAGLLVQALLMQT